MILWQNDENRWLGFRHDELSTLISPPIILPLNDFAFIGFFLVREVCDETSDVPQSHDVAVGGGSVRRRGADAGGATRTEAL
jgi:hypothetical protein